MNLEDVKTKDFEPLLKKTFSIKSEEHSADLDLVEVKPLKKTHPEGTREPFSLLFKTDKLIGQGIATFEADGFDGMEAFVTPIQGPDDDGYYCEVVFN